MMQQALYTKPDFEVIEIATTEDILYDSAEKAYGESKDLVESFDQLLGL